MSGGRAGGTRRVVRRVPLYAALAVSIAWACQAGAPPGGSHWQTVTPQTVIPQTVIPTTDEQGAGSIAAALAVRGIYTFSIETDLDGTCRWPMTRFSWPVSVQAASYDHGTMVGSIIFPRISSTVASTWTIRVGPAGAHLIPSPGIPGPAAAAYNLTVDGGSWDGPQPRRGLDGRGEIAGGTGSLARIVLVLPGEEKRWECTSDARWNLLTRYADKD